MLQTRTLLVATEIGIFEALGEGALPSSEVAGRCNTDDVATAKLLDALVGMGYLRASGHAYALTSSARKWLLKNSVYSLHDAVLFQSLNNRFLEHLEDYLRTGAPLHIHDHMGPAEWDLYQRGMRSAASLFVSELVRRAHVPRAAQRMLDIGGSHGYYSVAMCRKYPELRATILDLPDAVTYAKPLLERENMGSRITFQEGDVRFTELGSNVYDLILIVNLMHHFDADTNRDLVTRAARALRSDGALVIGEVVRPNVPSRAGQIGALTDLYFALTSEAGTLAFKDLTLWQHEAGLDPQKSVRLLTAPGGGLQVGIKRKHSTSVGTSMDLTHAD
jgi:SAM-dependent methyltransferase